MIEDSIINVSIIGATSFTGMELFRLLLSHPNVNIVSLSSESKIGNPVNCSMPILRHDKENNVNARFVSINDIEDSDVLFSCLPAGILPTHIQSLSKKGKLIINLAGDYRFSKRDLIQKYYPKSLQCDLPCSVEYVIPELMSNNPKDGIINLPGCMAVACFYAIYPLVKHNLIKEKIIFDVKTGSSGAGKDSKDNPAERYGNVRPHKIYGHRHGPEVQMAIKKYLGKSIEQHFSNYSLDISRGILASAYTTLNDGVNELEVRKAFYKEYQNTFFIRYLTTKNYQHPFPMTKTVAGTNYVEVSTSVSNSACASIVTLDNLIKGAAGQAVQVMNKLFNLSENIGLDSQGYWP